MTEQVVHVDEARPAIVLAEAPGVPKAAQADNVRLALAREARPQPQSRVLDLCCGAGLVGIAAAKAEPSAEVIAAEVNLRLCRLAAANADRNTAANLRIEHSDGFPHLESGEYGQIYFTPPPHCSAVAIKRLLAESLEHLRPGGHLVLAANQRAGGKRHVKWAEGFFGNAEPILTQRRLEVWSYRRPDGVDVREALDALEQEERDCIRVTIRGHELQFETRANVFAWSALDAGTALLLAALPDEAGARILDLGCGYGPVGIMASRLYEGSEVVMVDVDRRALDLASANVELNDCEGIEVIASDGFFDLGGRSFDLVLSNLPTHIGRQADRELLTGARDHLEPGGRLVAVISRELHVDQTAGEVFGNVETLVESGGHRVFRCERRR